MNTLIFLKSRAAVKGFTLVELLVASAVFSTVLVIAIGSLFTAQTVNARLQETQVILDSVNLTTEVISRDVRYGSEFHCDSVPPEAAYPIDRVVPGGLQGTGNGSKDYSLRTGCVYIPGYSSGGSVVVFKPIGSLKGTTNASLDRIVYKKVSTTLFNGRIVGSVVRQELPYGGPVKEYQITASDVDVTSFKIYARGSNSSQDTFNMVSGATDTEQPLISISISGMTIPADPKTAPVKFDIETSVSPRGLDN
jgi:prepilin-type N-terminal cleavage/methylation domain-containing protein